MGSSHRHVTLNYRSTSRYSYRLQYVKRSHAFFFVERRALSAPRPAVNQVYAAVMSVLRRFAFVLGARRSCVTACDELGAGGGEGGEDAGVIGDMGRGEIFEIFRCRLDL